MDNSGFRAFALNKPKEEATPAPTLSAEERAKRKEKQQAAYERRMAIQKRREEALAEASRYVDRAAERRKEEGRQQLQTSFYDDLEEREAKLAADMARDLLGEGIYDIGFSYPVVPKGKARIRVQLSAAHSDDDITKAVAAFTKSGKQHDVLS